MVIVGALLLPGAAFATPAGAPDTATTTVHTSCDQAANAAAQSTPAPGRSAADDRPVADVRGPR